MGILRNGFYTRGYKTTEEIYDLIGMRFGDTVFDTTRKERLVYDGHLWVSGNMITKNFQSSSYAGGYIDYVKAGQNVGFYTGTNNNSQEIKSALGLLGPTSQSMIGIVQCPKNRSYGNNTWVTVQYSGEGFVWAHASGNWRGRYIIPLAPANSTVPFANVGWNDDQVSQVLNLIGVYTTNPVATTVSVGPFTGTAYFAKGFIRPSES